LDSSRHGGVDLHIHTSASDGTHTPREILRMATQLGLQAIAITDHDTTEGARLAATCEIPGALSFLAGVEISAQAPPNAAAGGSLHILGYGIDVNDPALQRALDELQRARANRTPAIVTQLNRLGIPISLERVAAEVGSATAGRPHVATVLVEMGVVATIDEAFDRYLGKNRPAYVDKYRLDCRHAIELIRGAGGVPVLAHPYLVKCDHTRELPKLLERLHTMGLMGVEVYYPEHPPGFIDELVIMAQRYDLLVTGGTDFHGDLTPGIQLGRGYGELHVPYAVYEALVARIHSVRSER
jgi:predicted metal-dependent phosphoesterase TrpH